MLKRQAKVKIRVIENFGTKSLKPLIKLEKLLFLTTTIVSFFLSRFGVLFGVSLRKSTNLYHLFLIYNKSKIRARNKNQKDIFIDK